MPERLHGAALEHAHAAVPLGPLRQALPAAAILEQSTVGDLMGQRMLECVFGVGE
jgi:hypothetical protein